MTDNHHGANVAEQATRSVEKDGIGSALVQAAPTILVLVLLAGLAYAGHATGWTVPKFADLFGESHSAKDDWCEKHSVPESICVEPTTTPFYPLCE